MMYREPDVIPLQAGVFALLNRKRRFAYVSYTGNLQKRSHSMSHMLLSHDADAKVYWPIRDLPKHPSDEFTFKVMSLHMDGVNDPLEMVARAQKKFMNKGYRIIGGQRAVSPMVTLKGKQMTLAEAVRDHSKVKYLTAYRRLERGWTVEQALGLEAPAPRWHQGKQAARKEREAERAGA
jgi:hypothetical protein